MNLTPIPKPRKVSVTKTDILTDEEYRLGFTGIEDVDAKLLNYLDFKTLISLFTISKYVERLIKKNKEIYDLITLLKDISIYDRYRDIYKMKNSLSKMIIEDYMIELLEKDKINRADKILKFFETKRDQLDTLRLNEELYVKLLNKIINKNLHKQEYLYENLFLLKPRNLSHNSMIPKVLPNIWNVDFLDFLPLIVAISHAAKNINDIKLIHELQHLLIDLNDSNIRLLYNDYWLKEDSGNFMDYIDELRDLGMLSKPK